MRQILFFVGMMILLSGAPVRAGVPDGGAQPVILPVDEQSVQELVRRSLGRVLLVNVWATWCVPCVEEFPDILKLRTTYAPRGLDVQLISIDNSRKSLPAVRAFLKKMDVVFPTYIKSAKTDESFINALHPEWSGAVPATFVYDRTGKLVHTRVDAQTYSELVELVEPLLSR